MIQLLTGPWLVCMLRLSAAAAGRMHRHQRASAWKQVVILLVLPPRVQVCYQKGRKYGRGVSGMESFACCSCLAVQASSIWCKCNSCGKLHTPARSLVLDKASMPPELPVA